MKGQILALKMFPFTFNLLDDISNTVLLTENNVYHLGLHYLLKTFLFEKLGYMQRVNIKGPDPVQHQKIRGRLFKTNDVVS